MKWNIKMDSQRIGVILYTLIFGVFLKLILDNMQVSFLNSISVWIMFALAPVMALLIAQKLGEGKTDIKEVGVFVAVMWALNVGLVWLSAYETNIFNASMTTTVGATSTLLIYFINLPMSVIFADMISDKYFKGG